MTLDEHELRDRLGRIEVPPTRLDMPSLVGAGKRQGRRRRAWQVGGCAALAAVVAAGVPSIIDRTGDHPRAVDAASGAERVTCAASRLPVPAGMRHVAASVISPNGRYVAGNDVIPDTYGFDTKTHKVDGVPESKAVLWTDGQARVLPANYRSAYATAVNSSGVVVVLAGTQHDDTVLRYTGGVSEQLTTPPGTWDFRQARINDRGDVVATAYHRDGGEKAGPVLVWHAGSTTPVQVPLPPGAEAVDIMADGSLVGNVMSADRSAMTGYVWDQRGRGRKLPTPAGQEAAVTASEGEWAVGELWPSGAVGRWNVRTGEVNVYDVHGPGHGVNAKGWVVAVSTILRDGATVTLATVDGVAGEPSDVSDTGVVVGAIYVDTSTRELTSAGPVSWVCPG